MTFRLAKLRFWSKFLTSVLNKLFVKTNTENNITENNIHKNQQYSFFKFILIKCACGSDLIKSYVGMVVEIQY